MLIWKGDTRQGEDEHQQADHDRLCGQHIHRHDSHVQPNLTVQTQAIHPTSLIKINKFKTDVALYDISERKKLAEKGKTSSLLTEFSVNFPFLNTSLMALYSIRDNYLCHIHSFLMLSCYAWNTVLEKYQINCK